MLLPNYGGGLLSGSNSIGRSTRIGSSVSSSQQHFIQQHSAPLLRCRKFLRTSPFQLAKQPHQHGLPTHKFRSSNRAVSGDDGSLAVPGSAAGKSPGTGSSNPQGSVPNLPRPMSLASLDEARAAAASLGPIEIEQESSAKPLKGE